MLGSVGSHTVKLLTVSGGFLSFLGYALILRDTSFVLTLDIFYTLKGYVTCAVYTYFATAFYKLDNSDTLIGYCGLGGVGRSLLMPDGVDYGLGGVSIRQTAISVGMSNL